MRTQRKAPQSQAAHSSNKTAVPGWPDRLHRGRACPPGGARPRVQRRAGESARSRLRRAPGQGSKLPERSTPMIPLTLRAMNRTRRQRGRNSARSVASLLSVLVLVALACFPVLAHAASEIPQYETEVPTTRGHKHPPTHSGNPPDTDESHSNGGATASDSGQAGTPGSGSSSGGSSSGGASANAGNNPSTASGGGNGQGSPGNGATAGDKPGTLTQAQPANSNASSSDDGGSSPLVPILIAIAALAAISIGAVVIRQRRQGPGSPISPEAS